MGLMYIKFLFLISISIAFAQKNSETKECKDLKKKFDEHISNVFGQFGVEGNRFPESRSKLTEYCKKSADSNTFAKNYGQKCLKDTSQTLMSLAVYNFERTNKQYCAKNGKLKDQFVSWSKCGNSARKDTVKCWDSMLQIMANARKVKNSKSRVPIICCNYYAWTKCTVKALRDNSNCDKSAVDGYDQHISKSSVDAMNLICKRYEDNDQKCAQLYTQLPANKPKSLNKTPLLYVFDVFDSL